jgi:riboflavin kinase/FMN adenylyltransferase
VDHRDQCPDSLRGGVVAIGNFDGMHRGHQALLETALTIGRERHCPVVALTFEPHPRSVFNPAAPVFRLTAPAIKARVASALGVDGLVVLPFDTRLAAMPAHAFIDEILIGGFALEHAVVGWDFHFGHKRSGSPGYLQDQGRQAGFGVTIIEPFVDEAGETVSSSRIRDALAAGALGEANGLLGYRWRVEAEIIHGEKRGRQLGYPTANMRLGADCRLRHGIYAVSVAIDGRVHPGVASYGRRPTFDNGAPLLETYLFDFKGDLYGKTGTVAFVSHLRDEMRFDSVEALIAQMDRDSAEARAVLTAVGPGSVIDRALDHTEI